MAVRAFSMAVALAAFTSGPALAQSGGMPSWPTFAAGIAAAARRSVSKLLADRDETQKHGQALQVAGKKKAPPDEVCKLFNAFLAAEGKLIKGLEENSVLCGVPADVIKQVKAGHGKASQVSKQVCEMAERGAQPAAPSLSEALGTTPTVPDSATASKRGAGTFDTLTGSPLAR